jgi:hypothetical protein
VPIALFVQNSTKCRAVKPIRTRSFDDTPNLIEACGIISIKSSRNDKNNMVGYWGHVARQCVKWMLTTSITGDGIQVFVKRKFGASSLGLAHFAKWRCTNGQLQASYAFPK